MKPCKRCGSTKIGGRIDNICKRCLDELNNPKRRVKACKECGTRIIGERINGFCKKCFKKKKPAKIKKEESVKIIIYNLPVSPDKKYCSVCGKEEMNLFRKRCSSCHKKDLFKCLDCENIFSRKGNPYRTSICKSCKTKRQNKTNKNKDNSLPENYFKRILREIKNRKKKCDLTLDQLMGLYEKQEGLCAISNLPMKIGCKRMENGGISPYAISIDRIDNDGDYTIENVWLICISINNFKSTHDLGEVFYIAKKICENNSIHVD